MDEIAREEILAEFNWITPGEPWVCYLCDKESADVVGWKTLSFSNNRTQVRITLCPDCEWRTTTPYPAGV